MREEERASHPCVSTGRSKNRDRGLVVANRFHKISGIFRTKCPEDVCTLVLLKDYSLSKDVSLRPKDILPSKDAPLNKNIFSQVNTLCQVTTFCQVKTLYEVQIFC